MKTKALVLVIVMLVVWGLKRHYSDARADDLGWILSPTARLVGLVSGTPFVLAPGEGYVSHERLFLIEKSCAGINFMAAAFVMLVFTLFRRVTSAASSAGVLAASLRVRETILPLLLLPVLAPVLIAATRAFEDALGQTAVDGWSWFVLLTLTAVVYSAFGALAFGTLLEES